MGVSEGSSEEDGVTGVTAGDDGLESVGTFLGGASGLQAKSSKKRYRKGPQWGICIFIANTLSNSLKRIEMTKYTKLKYLYQFCNEMQRTICCF